MGVKSGSDSCFTCLSAFSIYLLTLSFCFRLASSAILSNETDRLALLALKASITDDPFGALSSWNNSIHFCQWSGVTCGRRHQRVTVINLQSHKLVGSISPYIGNLSFLTKIDLQNNILSNDIPLQVGRLRRLQILFLRNNSLIGEIPANLSGCHQLTNLRLDNNKLEGKIPSELGSLTKLKVLDISNNNLIGNIPSSFGNMSSLVTFFMATNKLSGTIPSTLGNLKNLKLFAIDENGLEGTIPPSIFNISSMEEFDVGTNQLHGSLPSDLFTYFSQLTYFVVGNNQFSGSIPSSLSNASNLEIVFFTLNNLTGRVPNLEKLHALSQFGVAINSLGFGEAGDLSFLTSLNNATSLQLFQITGNNFGGVLPESISNLSTQLRVLAIDENQIEGTIPSVIGNLQSLEALTISRNRLSGSIPKEIGNLHQKLQYLYLGENELTGNIPSSIGYLNNLIQFDLSTNKLQGSIPPSLGNCTSLLYFSIAKNNINGTIPPQLFNLSTLAIVLDLSDNHLTGALPVEVGNLKNLGTLYLSGNRLSGEIPSSVGSCVSMESLGLENNLFQGTIPSSLSSLKGLESLDLSHNNLSGEIPKFLGDLVLLNYLNLSFNNFVGSVPDGGVFKNASATSLEGNKELCGGIPEFHLQVCKLSESPKNKRFSGWLKIVIFVVLAFLGAIMITVCSLLFLFRKKSEKDDSRTLENSLLQVSYQTLLKATDGFSSSHLIGAGGFGSVYKGTLYEDRVVAVKVFNLQRRGAFKSFIAECEAMKNIRHRNLVKVITACSSIDIHGNDFKALVYEFMVNGSLEEWLHPNSELDVRDVRRKLNIFQRLNIVIDVASALDYLHHQYCQTPIVHCDLKPSNILLDDEMTAQVGDFGLVKFLLEETNNTQIGEASSAGVRGTVGYAAPEYGMGSEVSTRGDVYSYGILILEMFSGKRPTDNMFNDNMNLHNYVKRALPQHVEDIVEPMLLDRREEDEIETGGERHQKVIESLVLIFGIGIACSEETPTERMNMSDVLAKLFLIRDKLIDNRGRGRRADQVPRTHIPEA